MLSKAGKRTSWVGAGIAALLSADASLAQSSAAPESASRLEEIVVVARRREEAAQDVPLAISQFSARDISARAIRDVKDLQYLTPSLQIQQNQSQITSTNIAIRGQVQLDTLLVLDPSVGIYMDGIYLGTHVGTMATAMRDVERVEVLKGPQGTLYGRNTTGGAFNIITQQPKHEFEGSFTVGGGNYGTYGVEGMINLPLVKDKAALRVTGQFSDSDGYGEDNATGHEFFNPETKNVRATLGLDPSDDLSVTLRGEWTRLESGGVAYNPIYIDPFGLLGLAATVAANGPPPNPFAVPSVYGPFFDDGKYDGTFDGPNSAYLDIKNAAATIAYDFGAVQLKSLTGYKDVKTRNRTDLDASPYPLFQGVSPVEFEQITQEFQLVGAALADRLTYTVGLFYFYLDGRDQNRSITAQPLGLPVTVQDYDITTKSPSLYTQATYKLTPTVSLTGGLRYTDDKKELSIRNRLELGPLTIPNVPLDATQLPSDCDVALGSTPTLECDVDSNNVSYTASIDWNPSEDVLLYARTGRGFKGGGINGRTSRNPLTVSPFDPEVVTDYELGVKSEWLDNRLRANLAVYRSYYKDIQRAVFIVDPLTGTPISVVRTADEATIDGVEAEFTALPIDNLLLQATLTYTKPEYKDYAIQEVVGGPEVDRSDEAFHNISKWVYSLSAGYTIPSSVANTRLQLDWYWRDDHNLFATGGAVDADGNSLDVVDAYGLLNGSLTFEVHDWDTEIKLWGKNLLDKRYIGTIFDVSSPNPATSLGGAYAIYGEPRTYGLQLTKRFGG